MKHTLPGGATRSERAPDHTLVPTEGLRCIVQRFELGREEHGAWQWLRSLDTRENAEAFCHEAVNHIHEHLAQMLVDGTKKDDHLGAIGWGVCVLAYARKQFGDEVLPVQPKPPTRVGGTE